MTTSAAVTTANTTDGDIERQLLAVADAVRTGLPAMSPGTLDAVAAICLNVVRDAAQHMTPADARATISSVRSLADSIERRE